MGMIQTQQALTSLTFLSLLTSLDLNKTADLKASKDGQEESVTVGSGDSKEI